MDPRRSPQSIGNAHLADRLAYLRRYSWSAPTAPRLPPPVRIFRTRRGAKFTSRSPASRSPKRAQYLRSQTIQAGENQTVQHPERRPFRRLPPQPVKRMTQNGVFRRKRGPRPERSDQHQPNWATDLWHKAGASPDSISVASKIEFPTGTTGRMSCVGRQAIGVRVASRSVAASTIWRRVAFESRFRARPGSAPFGRSSPSPRLYRLSGRGRRGSYL